MPIAILRRADTSANWTSNNPIIPSRQLAFTLNAGEFGTPLIKFGNGSSNWADLPYLNRKNNLTATTNPATSNNASQFYSVGSLWLNTTGSNQQLYVLNNFSGSNAIWLTIGEVIRNLSQIQDVPAYPNDGYVYALVEEDGVLSWELFTGGGGGGAVDSVNGQTGVVILTLEDLDDVPAYPNDGYQYVLVEENGALTWELFAVAGGITESDLINTLRSFSAPQWLDVATLTPSAGVFTPDLGTAGSFTADWGANSTLADPIIPSGYDTGKVLAWDITFTVTGAGGWTMDLGSSYRVDDGVDIAAILGDNNTTGDVVQLFFQDKNGIVRIQPFIDTVIP